MGENQSLALLNKTDFNLSVKGKVNKNYAAKQPSVWKDVEKLLSLKKQKISLFLPFWVFQV